MSTETKDVYELVTSQIIAQLHQGKVPWHTCMTDTGAPRDFVSKKLFHGINVWLLSMLGYEQNYFLTFDKVKELECSVKKGEKGHIVVYWKKTEGSKYPGIHSYKVFNIAQCEGLPEAPSLAKVINPVSQCDHLLFMMGNRKPLIEHHHSPMPFYDVQKDLINIPAIADFNDVEAYYSLLFQELIHSTGHEKRLHRKEVMFNAEGVYGANSKEMMTAHMGASYLKATVGIKNFPLTYVPEFLLGWIKVLEDDKYFVSNAASQAQQAIDYILNDPIASAEDEVTKKDGAVLATA